MDTMKKKTIIIFQAWKKKGWEGREESEHKRVIQIARYTDIPQGSRI